MNKRENTRITDLNTIINKKSHYNTYSPIKKATEYSSLLYNIEDLLKHFSEEEKQKNYYKRYLEEAEKLKEEIAQIYFDEKMYKQSIEIDKNLIKDNKVNHKSYVRLYKAYLALGDEETAVIYGSFLLYRCDKKNQELYKDLLPEIKSNLMRVAQNYKNKGFFDGIKFDRAFIIRAVFLAIFAIYLFIHFKGYSFYNLFK